MSTVVRRIIFFIVLFFTGIVPVSAGEVADRVAIGKEHRQKHPNETFVAKNVVIHIKFHEKKRKKGLANDNLIYATSSTKVHLISLKDGFGFSDRVFYSEGVSWVEDIYYSLGKKKKLLPRVSDNGYQDNDIFHHDIRFKKISFHVGDLGQEASFRYTEEVRNIKYLPRLFFHNWYKAEKKTIIIDVPVYLDIDIKEFNFEGFEIEHTVLEVVEKKTKVNRHEYTFVGGSKLKKEYKQANVSFNYPHLIMVPKIHNYKGKELHIFSDSKDLYKWYSHLTDALEYNNQTYKSFTLDLIKECQTDEERIKKIYYWVQDNIRYIAFEDGLAGFKPDEAHLVYKNKYGDCKGMANLSKAMLKVAGFDARLAWLGTASLPYDYSLPSLYVDNHMICALKYKNEWLYIDGTEKFQNLGSNAYRIRGKQIMIQSGSSDPIIETIPASRGKSDAFIQKFDLQVTEDGIQGKAAVTLEGDTKGEYLHYMKFSSNGSENDLNKYYFAKNNPMVSISNLQCINCNQRDEKLIINYDLAIRNKVNFYGEEIFMEYEFHKEHDDFKKEDKRISDLSFHSYEDINLQSVFNHPASWKVKHLPESIGVENEVFKIHFSITSEKGKLVYNKQIKIKNGKINVDHYDEFAKVMERVIEFYNDQVVFLK